MSLHTGGVQHNTDASADSLGGEVAVEAATDDAVSAVGAADAAGAASRTGSATTVGAAPSSAGRTCHMRKCGAPPEDLAR